MITTWRLSGEPFTSKTQAFDGEGAYRTGRRWNSRGVRVVYAASTIALATLEILVNLEDIEVLRRKYVAFRAEIPEEIIQTLVPDGDYSGLPRDWAINPKPPSTKAIGDGWVRGGSSAVLEVPSAIVPLEMNYVLNPAHSDFKLIKIFESVPVRFDPRLERGLN